MTVGPRQLAALLEPFEPLRQAGRVQHKVQTGATLITDAWCELFGRHGIPFIVLAVVSRDCTHRAVEVLDFLRDLGCRWVGLFAYCQGAHAGDRYFEHGTFTATETEHCRTSVQAPVLALADLMEGKKTG